MDYKGMTGKEWQEVVGSLEDLGPYYERANSLMTFGLVDRWRRRVASNAKPDDTVLEIGSGPGNFTRHLSSAKVYCLEPSTEFARSSQTSFDGEKVAMIRGIGEKIPLSDASVDKVFCVFSFRDFFDRTAAAGEMLRVLREGGEVFIADVAKPPAGPLAKMLEIHFRHLVPVLAKVAVNPAAKEMWTRDPYAKLVETYEAYGTPSMYEELLRGKGFSGVSTEYLEFRGATMTRGKKPWKSTS